MLTRWNIKLKGKKKRKNGITYFRQNVSDFVKYIEYGNFNPHNTVYT
jgi:hypothetical protein